MGRLIIADESAVKHIEKLSEENKWFVGVMIGQQTAQRDYVVHLARTPDPVENEVHEETPDPLEESGQTQPMVRPKSLTDLNEQWVLTHAKQVIRMLPGGLSIVGLFAIAPTAMLKAGQDNLRKMMYSVYKQLDKNASKLSSTQLMTERILMQMDTSTKKVVCVTLDTADSKKGTKPADWKQQSGGSKWCRLNSSINMEIPIVIPEDSNAQSLLKQIQCGLSDFLQNLDKSVITIGDRIQEGSKVLSPNIFKTGSVSKVGSKSGRLALPEKFKGKSNSSSRSSSISSPEKCEVTIKPKGKGSNSKLDKKSNSVINDEWNFDVSIYLPFQPSPEAKSVQSQRCKANISIVGTALVRAFVSTKCTVAEAIEAVKNDVMRSIAARCELLCEEFDVAEVEKDSQVYDPPARLFVQLPNSQIQVCDYVFQDEKLEEVVSRIHELMDIEDFDIDEVERSAADDDTISQPALPHFVDSVLQETAESLRPAGSPSGTLIDGYPNLAGWVVAAGVCALVAGGVSYMLEYV